MAHQPFRFPAPGTRPPRAVPAAVRDPLRLVTLAGASMMAIGSLSPWIRAWKPDTGWFDVSGFQQAGDGAVAGGVGGFIAGSQIAGLLTQGSAVGASAILVALAFSLGFLGAWVGMAIATGAVRALQRP